MPKRLYIFYLGFVAAVPPLATDMYLPAIPSIAAQWGVDQSLVNLSMVLWFVSFSFTLLIWGSLSDRFGRRPILVTGLVSFALATILCAGAQDVWQLIGARVLQGIAAAGASSMVLAIARDQFEGRIRQRVLAWIGIVLGLAPMLAPSIGALILEYGDWRFLFVAQAVLAAIALVATLSVYRETAKELDKSGFMSFFSRYGRVAQNYRFVITTGAAGLLAAPMLGFVAFSPIAYIVHFKMSETNFGLLFGANALCVIAGSMLCTRLINRFNDHVLLTVAFSGCLLGGLTILFFGFSNWIMFFLSMAVYSSFFGISRPLVNHLMLEQVHRDIGAASSTIICYQFLCGAIGMTISTYDWSYPFFAFGLLAAVSPLITLSFWPVILRFSTAQTTDQTISEPISPTVPQPAHNRAG